MSLTLQLNPVQKSVFFSKAFCAKVAVKDGKGWQRSPWRNQPNVISRVTCAFCLFCRAVSSCRSCLVCDAAVSLLRLPVRNACYDAGLLGCGRGGTHMWLGIAVWQALRVRGGRGRAARSTCGWGSPCGRHCVCEAGGGARRQAGAYSVRALNSWPSRGVRHGLFLPAHR